jgi:hypothetical protein
MDKVIVPVATVAQFPVLGAEGVAKAVTQFVAPYGAANVILFGGPAFVTMANAAWVTVEVPMVA